jgi:hypothetical protein
MQLPIKTADEERQIHEPGTYWGAQPPAAKRQHPAGGARLGPAREAIDNLPPPPLATSAGQRREQQQRSELATAQILLRGEGLEVAGDGTTSTSSSTSRRADLRCPTASRRQGAGHWHKASDYSTPTTTAPDLSSATPARCGLGSAGLSGRRSATVAGGRGSREK